MTQSQYEAVSRILQREWFITAEDAGFGPDDYEMGSTETPEEFVEWYAHKYDLHDFREPFGRQSP